jgi:iduronate 2-sulfatase
MLIQWKQWLFLGCLSALGMILVSPRVNAQSANSPGRPNVLFIAVDDMRCDLGCYGVKHVHSPNLDRLAASGVLFHRAYCQLAVCNPSRASVMTGLRPDTTKVWDLVTDFRRNLPKAVTIPQHFRKHGYKAVAFGKLFHNTFPDDVSWDEPTHHAKDVIGYSTENQDRLKAYKQTMKADGKSEIAIERMRGPATEIQDQPDEKNYDGKQTSNAIVRMRELSSGDSPFFLAVGFIRPHLPFITPKKYWDLYEREKIPLATNSFLPRGMPPVAFGERSMGGFYELRGYMNYADAPSPFERPLTEEQQRELKHGYYASVSFIDAQVGRLLDALDELQIAKNTVVVLWSDHGWKLGEHGGWCKQTNYEIDTHVPMMIRVPDAKANGQGCNAIVECVDIYPTLCDVAGLPVPTNLEGKSLAPLLANVDGKVKDGAISQFERKQEGQQYMGYAIRTEHFRYIEWLSAESGKVVAQELYDHRNDPDENDNIASMPKHANLLSECSDQLWKTIPRPTFPHPILQSSTSPVASKVQATLPWFPHVNAPLPPSRPKGEYRNVTFINGRIEPVELWWLGPNGENKSYGVLANDARKDIRTRRGAVWYVEDNKHQSLGHFVTIDENATATIPADHQSTKQ